MEKRCQEEEAASGWVCVGPAGGQIDGCPSCNGWLGTADDSPALLVRRWSPLGPLTPFPHVSPCGPPCPQAFCLPNPSFTLLFSKRPVCFVASTAACRLAKQAGTGQGTNSGSNRPEASCCVGTRRGGEMQASVWRRPFSSAPPCAGGKGCFDLYKQKYCAT